MSLSPASELILRNQSDLNGRVLFAHVPDDGILNQLRLSEKAMVLTDDWRSFRSLGSSVQAEPLFHAVLQSESTEQFDQVVLYMPKAKEQARFLIAQLVRVLKPAGTFWLVGENNGGIKSADKLLMPFTDNVVKHDKAKKSLLLSMQVVVDKVPEFNLADWQQNWLLSDAFAAADTPFSANELELISLPGVFSHGRLDEGTLLLLQHLPKVRPSVGRIPKALDMGCGCGVIAMSLLQRQPELELTACDVSAMATEATRMGLEHNHLTASVQPSDMWQDIEGRFDLVISNPPFHTGLKTDYAPTEAFISQAKKHLNRGGELRIVANRFLKYPDLIEAVFGNCERIAETGKFCVWSARVL
ncbi:methyltransferase [Oceanospirillum sediminis]|uniref:Ribosomal RNA small subunit methyltransferase C n=1 Tax=Oceanospirillum sediminis TaxID=2760088 RepID=A0A839IJD7_9GAMM|nr:methyltransferase [Oceanospirillum sediminis]MBB1485285.1 methyltransferase [Oceanospirillum sediminis]